MDFTMKAHGDGLGTPDFTPTAEGLVEFCKQALVTPHVYVWDGFGEYLTDEYLDGCIERWPDWYTPARIEVRRVLCNRNLRSWDCIGMIKSYVWNDYSQLRPEGRKEDIYPNYFTWSLIESDAKKGDIRDLPERPGLVLWKPGHVGVYIGNGEAIECTRRDSKITGEKTLLGGIVKLKITDTPWEKWIEYPGIRY